MTPACRTTWPPSVNEIVIGPSATKGPAGVPTWPLRRSTGSSRVASAGGESRRFAPPSLALRPWRVTPCPRRLGAGCGRTDSSGHPRTLTGHPTHQRTRVRSSSPPIATILAETTGTILVRPAGNILT